MDNQILNQILETQQAILSKLEKLDAMEIDIKDIKKDIAELNVKSDRLYTMVSQSIGNNLHVNEKVTNLEQRVFKLEQKAV